MAQDNFPKEEAGKLAVAAQKVLGAKGVELGYAMVDLSIALKDYDNKIMALATENHK